MSYPSNSAPVNQQTLQDAAYIANVALPSGAANADTAALDLLNPQNTSTPGQTISGAYPVTGRVICNIATTASASGNSINMNVVIMTTGALANGAIDTSNYANLTWATGAANVYVTVVPGASATNATNAQFFLPIQGLKRFIKARAIGASNMGNLADATLTLELLF